MKKKNKRMLIKPLMYLMILIITIIIASLMISILPIHGYFKTMIAMTIGAALTMFFSVLFIG